MQGVMGSNSTQNGENDFAWTLVFLLVNYTHVGCWCDVIYVYVYIRQTGS